MIALKEVKMFYETPTPSIPEVSTSMLSVIDNEIYDRKAPGVLEQRLQTVRKELEQQSREHNRLLEMIRIQTTRLGAIEPLPGLFLARLEELLYVIEPKLKEGVVHEPIATPDDLDKRFNRGIAQLRLLLNRDHVLENKELLDELVQTKTALQSKRDETLKLRVGQEQLNQRLAAVMERIGNFDAEINLREERIAKLQKYIKESEARHHKLFVDRRSISNRRGTEPEFSFVGKRKYSSREKQPWQIISIVLGLICGCAVTLAGMWFVS